MYFVRHYGSYNEVFSKLSKQKIIKSIEAVKSKLRQSSSEDAAVLVPLCEANKEPSVLLTIRSSKVGRNKGDISFPGGIREPLDKSIIDSALRETEEEIGIKVEMSQVWTTMPGIERSGMQVVPVIAFIGDVESYNFKLSEDEVESVFHVTLESLCDPNNQYYTEFKPGYSLPVYIVGKYKIWGLTAGILHYLLPLLMPNMYKNVLPISFKPFKKPKS